MMDWWIAMGTLPLSGMCERELTDWNALDSPFTTKPTFEPLGYGLEIRVCGQKTQSNGICNFSLENVVLICNTRDLALAYNVTFYPFHFGETLYFCIEIRVRLCLGGKR